MNKKIIVTINPDGTQEIEVIGGDGKTCLKDTLDLERDLGSVSDRQFKPEYRSPTQEAKQLNEGRRQ